jgi:hypothetical protein
MMKTRIILALLVLLAIFQTTQAQNTPVNRANFRLQALKTDQAVTIDGLLDEEIWSRAQKTGPFHRITPTDTGYAQAQTEVMVAYDKDNIYMGIICFDPTPGKRPAESYRRDWSFNKNDNFFAAIDTYNDQTNGFAFGVNAVGGQWDGMQADGGKVANEWDGKWYSAVQNYEDRWVAEFRIPFRTIRYREGDTEWGINFSRLDLKTNEKSAWAPVPRQFASATLAFTGTLAWEDAPPESGIRASLIPYVSGKATRDTEAGDPVQYKANAGLDAKLILSTSMNLDVTLNPDYSQVEVDRQQVNLDRFELFFPEKRKFFLENSDLFANLGTETVRPFFSRRIGLNSPVIAGARLSGQAGENWRVGLMNMQTAVKDLNSADNYSVAVLQRKVLARSNVGVFLTNKQVVATPDDTAYNAYAFNRVAGTEFNFASVDNNWTGKAFYHQSFNPGPDGNRFATAGIIKYSTEQFTAGWSQAYIGGNYLAEMGFVRRTGYHQANPTIGYQFYTHNRRVTNHGPKLEADFYFEPDFSLTDREIDLSYSFTWRDRSVIALGLEESYIRLLEPFDPTNTGGVEIPAGTEINATEASLSYMSTQKWLFTFMLEGRYGGFFGGTRTALEAEMNYRVQPFGSISLAASYNRVLMPEPYTSADLILVGPRLDVTFTEKLFFTTFVQYNNQIDNVNVNMRFQWRFAPVSDLFIVYTENAYPTGWQTKNRGLVVKLSYWFN